MATHSPPVIVVATEDFEIYHDVVEELRNRQVDFTTIEPDEPLPPHAELLIVGPGEERDEAIPVVVAERGQARTAVDRALSTLREGDGRVVVGIDPGTKPGIAVLVGKTVVSAFQVPLADAPAVVAREIGDAEDAIVRIGDGARLRGSQLVDELDAARIELVDETGTTPYLGTGARGMGDVLAAVNIARTPGEPITGRSIEPTAGELQVIQDRSRRESAENRTIPLSLARKVAAGTLTLEEAIAAHRDDAEE